MATADGKVSIIVDQNAQKASADFDKLNRSLDQTSTSAKKVASETNSSQGALSGLGSTLGTLKAGLVATGVAFAGMKLAEFGGDIMKISSSFEQLNVAFGVMAGQQVGQQLVKDLTNLANVTPMTTQGLAENAKVMLAFGESSQNVISDLRMLGDISGGNQEKMNSMVLAFSQAGASGRLMGQDLLQMVNAGFNPLQTMSEKTGKSMGVLKQEMEQGKIKFSDIKQAMIDATSEGGRFYGMMDKQSQTLEGRLSTLADKWALVGKKIGDAFLPMAKKAVDVMVALADGTMRTIEWLESERSTLVGLKASWDQYWASKRHSEATLVFDFTPWKKQQEEVQKTAKKTVAIVRSASSGFRDSDPVAKVKKTKTKKEQPTEYDLYTKKINVLSDSLKMMSLKGQEGTDKFKKLKAELTSASIAIDKANKAVQVSLTPYDALQNKLQDAQLAMQNLASAPVVDINKFNAAKQAATELKIKLQEVNQACQIDTSPYDALNTKITQLKIQLQDLAVSGKSGTPAFNKIKNDYVEATNQMKQANTAVTNAMGVDWDNIRSTISTDLASAFTTPLQAGESAFQRFGNVALDIVQMIISKLLEMAVITPIINALTGGIGGGFMSALGFAKGGAFSNGNIVPFASGGIVSSPTMFNYSGGTGLMGEAGDEAIMPLTRGSNGKLGVNAQQSSNVVNIFNQSNSNIETVKRPNGDTDIFIRKVNNALNNERTNGGFQKALTRQQSKGVQAV